MSDAISRLIDHHLADPERREIKAIRQDVGFGMSSAADLIAEMATDVDMLEVLRRDPARGLLAIADALRRAVPA